MANKSDRFYFDNFVQAAQCSCDAAGYLAQCLTHYDADRMMEMLEQMHRYEHEGDLRKHEMSAALARAFVTPLDREDLALISQNIDDVTDSIEEVLQRFCMDGIREVTPEAIEFANKLTECCELMKCVLSELINYKKYAELHKKIIALNALEEECDQMYLNAAIRLREKNMDTLDILMWREIYDKMEDCADACEHVGDFVETVVMKNT